MVDWFVHPYFKDRHEAIAAEIYKVLPQRMSLGLGGMDDNFTDDVSEFGLEIPELGTTPLTITKAEHEKLFQRIAENCAKKAFLYTEKTLRKTDNVFTDYKPCLGPEDIPDMDKFQLVLGRMKDHVVKVVYEDSERVIRGAATLTELQPNQEHTLEEAGELERGAAGLAAHFVREAQLEKEYGMGVSRLQALTADLDYWYVNEYLGGVENLPRYEV